MVKFMLMVQSENGDWEGLGEHHFEIPPQRGDLITNNGEHDQVLTYKVIGTVHPMDGASTAGDLLVKLVGNGWDEYRAATKSLY